MNETSVRKRLFGDWIEIALYGLEDSVARFHIEEAYLEALRLEKIFNFFDEQSELSILNRKRRLEVSSELLTVLKNAMKLSKLTKGEYDVSIGKSITARKAGGTDEKPGCSYRDIKIGGGMVALEGQAMVDLGSIAKGYITDRVADFLKLHGAEEGIIDSRGDIRAFGKNYHELGIAHPRGKDRIRTIRIRNDAVATSGDYMQYYGSYKKSHILNQKDIVSISVVAPTLEEADAYATALFVSGKELREKLIKATKKIKVLTIGKDMDLQTYNGFDRLICRR